MKYGLLNPCYKDVPQKDVPIPECGKTLVLYTHDNEMVIINGPVAIRTRSFTQALSAILMLDAPTQVVIL